MPEHVMEPAAPIEAVQLEPFRHQVGGHSVVLHYDETTLCKALNKREQHFYVTLAEELKEFTAEYRGVIDVQLQEHDDGFISLIGYRHSNNRSRSGSLSPVSSGSDSEISSDHQAHHSSTELHKQNKQGNSLQYIQSDDIEIGSPGNPVSELLESDKKANHSPWSLRCHKRMLSKWRTQGQSADTSKFILLQNIAAQFKRPCVLDLKMGTRQHGDDAPESKIKMHMAKCLKSTSATLGVRVCGMQVYQVSTQTYINHDKYYGRGLNQDGFKASIRQFLQNGHTVRSDLIKNITCKLSNLYNTLDKQDSYRFYSSSLLIMYDGIDEPSSDDDSLATGKVVVKMIDFAHVTHQGFFNDKTIHIGPDKGYLLGLVNLIQVFKDVQDEFSS